MDGYVINIGHTWSHAMKRSVGPGSKIELNELYEQYGIKHGLKEGKEFVDWLRGVKLPDINKWKIVFNDEASDKSNIEDTNTSEKEEVDKAASTKVNYKKHSMIDNIAPIVEKKLEVKDIVGLSVREGRETMPKIQDINLLKYALQEANQLAGKDSLCIIIRKRIKELQLGR